MATAILVNGRLFCKSCRAEKKKRGIDGRTKKTYNKTQKYPSEGKEEESWL